jgi:hypothetical protein
LQWVNRHFIKHHESLPDLLQQARKLKQKGVGKRRKIIVEIDQTLMPLARLNGLTTGLVG